MNENQFVRKEFERDKRTRALINTDIKAFNVYKDEMARSKRINNIESEVTEIKSMLIKILDRIDNNGN
jgi:hypothetical protein